MDLPVCPFHTTLSPAAAAVDGGGGGSSDTDAVVVTAAIAAAAASVCSRSRHCGVFCVQNEAVQMRDRHHDNDEFQKKSADQPVSIEIQNEAADHRRDHQRPGLPFRFQRGVQVRSGHRQQTQVQVHEHDRPRTKAQAAVAPVHQYGQHCRGQALRQAESLFAAGRYQRRGYRQERDDEARPFYGSVVRHADSRRYRNYRRPL